MAIYAELILEWEMFQAKLYGKPEHMKWLFSENRAIYEKIWKKYGSAWQATDDNMIRRMRTASCKPKATDTHLEYVILITFPLQKWL